MFSYPDQLEPVAFHADLHESDGSITGLIEEVDDEGSGLISFTAVVNGTRRGADVDFRKTYDEFDPVCVVDYSGTIDAEGVEIAGEWVRLGDLESGSFVMRRERKSEQKQEQMAEAEVDVELDP